MTIRSAILQTGGITLLTAVAILPFDPNPWSWAISGCFLSAVIAIWVDVWSKK